MGMTMKHELATQWASWHPTGRMGTRNPKRANSSPRKRVPWKRRECLADRQLSQAGRVFTQHRGSGPVRLQNSPHGHGRLTPWPMHSCGGQGGCSTVLVNLPCSLPRTQTWAGNRSLWWHPQEGQRGLRPSDRENDKNNSDTTMCYIVCHNTLLFSLYYDVPETVFISLNLCSPLLNPRKW